MKGQHFSKEFQESVVRKYLTRGSRSLSQISQEAGGSVGSIYSWVNKYGNLTSMNKLKPKRPHDRTVAEKCQLVITYYSLSESDRGLFLREQGVSSDHLEQWKKLMEAGLEPHRKNHELATEKLKIKKLEKELIRKDKALAETAALLVLKKKVDSIWGTEDDE